MSYFEFQRPAGVGFAGSPEGAAAAALAATRRVAGWVSPWVWGFVIIPTLLSALYFFVLASDLYMSEARFIVRSQNRQMPSMVGSLLQGAGLEKSGDDASAVESFITSRDAARSLEQHDNLRAIYSRPEGDLISRFPGLVSGSSFETLYKHYLNYIEVSTDSTTGVIVLQAQAYRPGDAQAITQALVRDSENLVNELNARAESDAVQQARGQVDEAEKKLVDVQQQLTAYRVSQRVLDPKLDSTSIYTTLGGVMAARVATATQLAELVKNSPGNPAIPGLRTRLNALSEQFNAATNQVTGGSNSVAGKLGAYERLTLSEEIAAKMLESATQSLVTAQTEAQAKHLYVEHIAEPSLPDYAIFPRRLLGFGVSAICFLVLYSILWLLVAGVREHDRA